MIYLEALLIALAIGMSLNFVFWTFTLGQAFAHNRLDKISIGYSSWLAGTLWALVYLVHNLR